MKVAKWGSVISILAFAAALLPGAAAKQTKAPAGAPKIAAAESPQISAARKARDHGDAAALAAAVESARQEATNLKNFEAYMRLALLAHWSVEIAHARYDDAFGKTIASQGIDAAKQAVALQPRSADAHALLGQLYGEIIPFAFMGGIRFGPKSNDELQKALTLDPQSVEAHIGLGIDKIFTPATFGGSLPEAIELLKKAVELDPSSDTARAWLAQAYETAHQHDAALGALAEAVRLNPERQWLHYLETELGAAAKR